MENGSRSKIDPKSEGADLDEGTDAGIVCTLFKFAFSVRLIQILIKIQI